MRPNNVTEPHQQPFETHGRTFRKPLNQITEDRGAGRAVKEHHFHKGKGSAKHCLIDVGQPRTIWTIAKLRIEVKLLLFSSKTWGRVKPRIGPALLPLGQK